MRSKNITPSKARHIAKRCAVKSKKPRKAIISAANDKSGKNITVSVFLYSIRYTEFDKPDAMEEMMIIKVDRDTELAKMLLSFVENCSWDGVKDHIADMLRSWTFSDWETMFAAIADGKIVGMASVMKTDYYPLAEIYPWVSCVFVSEDSRGQKISGELIEYANRYLKENGFGRSYIPAEFFGLYEHYGYRYLKDIVNYDGGTDHLFVKDF